MLYYIIAGDWGRYAAGLALCSMNNPNDITRHGVDFMEGLQGAERRERLYFAHGRCIANRQGVGLTAVRWPRRRWTPLNGAFSEAQLSFLDQTLAECDARGDRAVILTHVAGASHFLCHVHGVGR